MAFPNPKSEFLIDVVDCLRRRSKALKHKWSKLVVDRVLVRETDHDIEMLELRVALPASEGSMTYSAQIFEDRWLHLFARKMIGKNVQWSWQKEGRLLSPTLVRSLINLIEETAEELSIRDLAKAHDATMQPFHGINEIEEKWNQIISGSLSDISSPHNP